MGQLAPARVLRLGRTMRRRKRRGVWVFGWGRQDSVWMGRRACQAWGFRGGRRGGVASMVCGERGLALTFRLATWCAVCREEASTSRPRGPPMLVEAALADVPASDQLRLVRLANLISIEARPFDPETYDMEEEGAPASAPSQHDTTLFWRWAAAPDGTIVRQSNARFVRWSDGSLQLLLGREALDVREIDVRGEHSYVFARHPNVIQGQGTLTKKMAFHPASLSSRFHRRLATAVDRRHARQSKVRMGGGLCVGFCSVRGGVLFRAWRRGSARAAVLAARRAGEPIPASLLWLARPGLSLHFALHAMAPGPCHDYDGGPGQAETGTRTAGGAAHPRQVRVALAGRGLRP